MQRGYDYDRRSLSRTFEAWFLAGVVVGLIVLFLFGRALYGAPAPQPRAARPTTRSDVIGPWRGKCSSWPIVFNLAEDGTYNGQWEWATPRRGLRPPTWWWGSWSLDGDRVYITETLKLDINEGPRPCLRRWSFWVSRRDGSGGRGVERDSGNWEAVHDERQ